MSENFEFVAVACMVIATGSIAGMAYNIDRIAKGTEGIADLLRQIRNLLDR